ncbi:Transposon Ty3-I Gag-Pol polyprotein [Labeo rohita]|uniref:Transposon Ty3-I Gag-Pol polyprotein n=1 Tax=Labeo rohita TaxID=84645 RepID=A0ABQ8L1D8_LABRO|nr:Transposon Ty3-I Gag-Pol polyprotein [Labeo rohita]
MLAVKTIQGKPLGHGTVRYSSPFITLQVGLFHTVGKKFLVLEDSTVLPAEYMAFQDVFSKQAATHLPPHRPRDCAIELLPGAQLPKGRVYPLSIPERQAIEEYIAEALSQGFIQPSTSPAASSFFFVGKKDGAALKELCGAQVLTKLDLRSAYNLIRIHVGDEWKTAFVTPTGHYEYRVMPNLAEHRQHVQQVLHKLRQHSLYLKIEKCEFHRPSVQFLGYIINAEDVQMDQGKVSVIQEWSQPLTVKELQRFLGFLNYYGRFIQNYSFIMAPLTSLLRGIPPPTKHFNGSKRSLITNLHYLREARRLNPRQAHWALFFTRFNFKITYRPGSKNISADALSRQFSSDSPSEPEPIIPSNLIISPILWDQDETIRQATLQEPAPPECPEGKIFVPHSQRLRLLGAAHQSTDPLAPPVPLLVAQKADTTTHSTEALVPYRSGLCDRAPKQVFRHFGLPEEIVSDRGPQFIFHVWKAFFKLLSVSVNLSSGYHPQTNGQTERKIQELGRYLRAYCHEDQHSWSRFLPWAEYAQNSLRQDTTGLTRFQCVLGYQPPLFSWMEEPSHVPAVDHWFRESERVWDSSPSPVGSFADKICGRQKKTCWLSTRDLRLCLPCRKLSPRYIGPFKILRQINDVTFQLQLPPGYCIHPTFHVSLLKPFFSSATDHTGAEAEPPPPEVLDQPSIFTVHEILDSQRRGGHLEYLVDWEGYGPEE